MYFYSHLSLLAVTLTVIGPMAYGAKNMANDALFIPKAKIPLARAVTIPNGMPMATP